MNSPITYPIGLHCPKCRVEVERNLRDTEDPFLVEEWCEGCGEMLELGTLDDPQNKLSCCCGIEYDDQAKASGAWHFEREHGSWICWCAVCKYEEGRVKA